MKNEGCNDIELVQAFYSPVGSMNLTLETDLSIPRASSEGPEVKMGHVGHAK